MRLKKVFVTLVVAPLILSGASAQADETATAHTALATSIGVHWNPIFESQYARIMAMADSAKKTPATLKSYKALLLDFLEVRRVINDGLASSTSDLDAVAAYAEEETGEFSSTISDLEKTIGKIATITCVKGKSFKKVTAVSPKCPSGYKKK